ncbi:MAG: hypothetical protein LBS79_11510 [Tannerella sp.]|nr:hypothetical protein [Tannerella sp.]
MKRLRSDIIKIGWLLMLVLALPFAVRTVHACLCSVHEADGGTHHDCATCATCRFSLSFFTGTESVKCDVFLQLLPFEIFIYGCGINPQTLYSYFLRAPPRS